MKVMIPLFIVYILSIVAVVILCGKDSSADIKVENGSEYKLGTKLFGILKIPKVQVRLGGTLAAFVVIFFVTAQVSMRFLKEDCVSLKEHKLVVSQLESKIKTMSEELDGLRESTKLQEWKVMGKIKIEDIGKIRRIDVKYLPPSPALLINDDNGEFILLNVWKIPYRGWQRFQFTCDGFYPDPVDLNSKENAIIDDKKKEIILKEEVFLEKVASY